MLDDIRSFIREMPLRYYLSGGLFSKQEPIILFHIGETEIEALVAYKKKALGYENELHRDPDAPPTTAYAQAYKPPVNGRRVTAKLASRYRVPQRCQHLFVVDSTSDELFLNLFTLEKLRRRTVEEVLADLREAPGQILSGWDRNDFRWHVLDAELRLSGNTVARAEDPVLLIGLSETICLSLELWSEEQGAPIVGIVPRPVAVLAWCNNALPTEGRHTVILVCGESGVVVGIFKDSRLTNLVRVQSIDDALVKIRQNADEFALEDPGMYLWHPDPTRLGDEEIANEELTIIDQEHLRAVLGAPLLLMEPSGRRAIYDGPVPHLLCWFAKQ
jgi:hypothetical protein